MYHFRNLVFEGGGVKGIAYAGALQVLEEKGILQNIVRVGGTSAGAITATLVGLNFSVAEITEILNNTNFTQFMDDDRGIVRDSHRLIEHFGWFKGDFFRNWLGELIAQKTGNPNTSFAEVQSMQPENGFKNMYIIGTNLSTHFGEVFSHETTPGMTIADAVRISMSIPLVFAAPRGENGDIYVDGGVLNNYPVKLFDRKNYVEQFFKTTDYSQSCNQEAAGEHLPVYNQETLGFRLDSGSQISIFQDRLQPEHRVIDNIKEYLMNIIATLMEMQQNTHLQENDWHRTIYINTDGVGTVEFGLPDGKKEMLVTNGRNGTTRYFDWFDREDTVAYNKPTP